MVLRSIYWKLRRSPAFHSSLKWLNFKEMKHQETDVVETVCKVCSTSYFELRNTVFDLIT